MWRLKFKGKNNKGKWILILVLGITFNFAKVSSAEEIGKKMTFKDYISEMYELDKEDARYDEKLENALEDYQNRYTMYVDIEYVLGRSEGRKKQKDYYNGPDSIVTDYGGDMEVSDDINVYMKNIGLAMGSRVGSGSYNATKKYLPYFKKYGEIYGVDPYLALALACQESGGNHSGSLRRNSGCGLMQIEAPGKVIKKITAKNIKTGNVDTMDITYEKMCDVELNIKAGVMDLASNLAASGGNVPAALQGYNYGTGGVNAVIKCYKNAKGINKSVEEIKKDTNHLGWMAYRIKIHQNPQDYFKGYTSGVCNMQGCPYKGKRHPSGNKYGDPFYVERILSYYNKTSSSTEGGAYGITAYFQGPLPNDYKETGTYYGDVRYGESTLKESGAGPCAIAMVVTALTKYITPDLVAKDSSIYWEKDKGSNIKMLTDVDKYDLKVEAIGCDMVRLKKELKKGKVAIAITGSREAGGIFGLFNRNSRGNFVVVFGIKEDGTLDVVDPDGLNYENVKDRKITFNMLRGETVGGYYVYSKK